jgi:hypothetical protein
LVIVEITGALENVFTLLIVCAVVKSTNVEFVGICETSASVPVDVGKVSVPPLVIVEMVGPVRNVLIPVIVCAVVLST